MIAFCKEPSCIWATTDSTRKTTRGSKYWVHSRKEHLNRKEFRHHIYGSKLVSRLRKICQFLELGPLLLFKTSMVALARELRPGPKRERARKDRAHKSHRPPPTRNLIAHHEITGTSPSKKKRRFECGSAWIDQCSKSRWQDFVVCWYRWQK